MEFTMRLEVLHRGQGRVCRSRHTCVTVPIAFLFFFSVSASDHFLWPSCQWGSQGSWPQQPCPEGRTSVLGSNWEAWTRTPKGARILRQAAELVSGLGQGGINTN